MSDLTHLSLYNHPDFSGLNVCEGQRYHRIDYQIDGRIVGSFAGVIVGEKFTSGFSAGFGGPDLVREQERLEVVIAFVDHCIAELEGLGVRTIEVRAKPQHYSDNEHYLEFAMLRNGFRPCDENLNFFIDVRSYRTHDDYVDSLRHAPRRQLKLALAQMYTWGESQTAQQLRAAYDVLVQSRERHGANLSLSFEYLQHLGNTFPGRLRFFSLDANAGMVAACLVYVIAGPHVQVMYWGDQLVREPRIPGSAPPIAVMNLVAYRIVEQALAEGWRTIDLGPSTSASNVNFGNCAFKSSINARTNFRRTFIRKS